MKELFDECVEVARAVFKQKNITLDPKIQIQNIFNYASTDKKFNEVVNTDNGRVKAELRSQIKLICELGLDSARGRKLVYVKTRGVNFGDRNSPNWVTYPDITYSYHAMIHVLVRSKSLSHITVLHTYQNYDVEYDGDINSKPIVKSWLTNDKERGDYTGCFVILKLHDGDVQTSFHHLSDILKTHKEYSKSNKTWIAHQQSMVAKSAIMEAIRYIPVFDDVVAQLVDDYDSEHDWDKEPRAELTPESSNWGNALKVFERDGNIDKILEKFDVSDENQELLKGDSNVL